MPDDAIMTEAPALGENAFGQHHHHNNGDNGDNGDNDVNSAPAASLPGPSPQPLATTFPKKRRGRPPGRPNTTVRDSDYGDNPLVQTWNAAKSDWAVPVVAIAIRDALNEKNLIHETQRAILRLPSRETLLFVQGWITAKHIASQRPSYVNGLLVHSRGHDAPVSCVQCAEKRAKNALGPFLTCRVLPGSYHNSCSNCKWFDNTSTCSLYTGPKPNRKRKAKEDLPPPPVPGAGPDSNADGANSDVAAQSDPQSLIHPQLQQPEADMTILTDPALSNPSAHSHPHTDVSGSDMPEAPSQPHSLSDSHFVLHKPGRGEDTQDAEDDGDGEYVQEDQLTFPHH